MQEAWTDSASLLIRHLNGGWGEVDAHDMAGPQQCSNQWFAHLQQLQLKELKRALEHR
jgi:hypothetical protein